MAIIEEADLASTIAEVDRPVISIFGSHAPEPGSEDYEMARDIGRMLAEAGYGVATGGYGGVMSAASQGASEGGGLVIGVSSSQVEASRATKLNSWVQLHVPFDALQERLVYLVKNNSGMIVMPGGIGTLSEFSLAWSYMQVGVMPRRPLVLVGEIWEKTIRAFVSDRYVSPSHTALLSMVTTTEDAVNRILQANGASRAKS